MHILQWFEHDRGVDELRQSNVRLDEKTYPAMYHVPGFLWNVCTRRLAVRLCLAAAERSIRYSVHTIGEDGECRCGLTAAKCRFNRGLSGCRWVKSARRWLSSFDAPCPPCTIGVRTSDSDKPVTANVLERARRPRNCRQTSAIFGAKSRKTPAGTKKRGLAELRLLLGQPCVRDTKLSGRRCTRACMEPVHRTFTFTAAMRASLARSSDSRLLSRTGVGRLRPRTDVVGGGRRRSRHIVCERCRPG